MQLENYMNNKGRYFTPICCDLIEEMEMEWNLLVRRRCCVIMGYGVGKVYFCHVDDMEVLFDAPCDMPMADLY